MAKQRKDQRAANKSVSPETDGPKAPGGDEPTRSGRAEPDQPSAYPERDDPVRGPWTPGESRTYVSLGRVGEEASGPESRSADDDSGSEHATPPDGDGDGDDGGGGDGGDGDDGDDGGGGGGDQPVAVWHDPDNRMVAHVRHTEDGPKVRVEQADDPAGDRSALKADRGEEMKDDPLGRSTPKDTVERTLANDGDTLADRMSEQVEAGLSVAHPKTRTGQESGPPRLDAPGHTDLVSVDQVTGLAFTLAAIAARVAGIVKRARGEQGRHSGDYHVWKDAIGAVKNKTPEPRHASPKDKPIKDPVDNVPAGDMKGEALAAALRAAGVDHELAGLIADTAVPLIEDGRLSPEQRIWLSEKLKGQAKAPEVPHEGVERYDPPPRHHEFPPPL
jgi:hypothetical protein